MSDEMKAQARAFYDAINQGNLGIIDTLVADNFVDHQAFPGIPGTKEGTRAFFAMMRSAFNDLHGNIEDTVAEDDKIVVRCTITGTNTGEFMGMPPTNKRVNFEIIEIIRIVDGKAVERWGQGDNAAMMQQLGAMPSPGGG
jgi:steroid delta-isomerase-like uncharacterized protein